MNTHKVVSPDHHIYNDQGTYEWSVERAKRAWEIARAELRESLPGADRLVLMVGIPGAGKSEWIRGNARPGVVYFDATLTGDRARAEFVNLAGSMKKPVDVVWIDTPTRVCLKRNADRSPDRRVPDADILKMADKLRRFPPSYREGFSSITRVG